MRLSTALLLAVTAGALSCRQTFVTDSTAAAPEGWRPLFDGRSLAGWEIVDFGGQGDVRVEEGRIVLEMGSPMTGIRWTGSFPRSDYEIELEAMRVDGNDFFCGLTFPIGDSHASLIVGGWAGTVTGISSLDGYDASENETMRTREYENNRWYPIRLRVRGRRIEAWIGEEKMVDVDTTGRRVGLRSEIAPCAPLGFATWQTTAALRGIRWRPLPPQAPDTAETEAAR